VPNDSFNLFMRTRMGADRPRLHHRPDAKPGDNVGCCAEDVARRAHVCGRRMHANHIFSIQAVPAVGVFEATEEERAPWCLKSRCLPSQAHAGPEFKQRAIKADRELPRCGVTSRSFTNVPIGRPGTWAVELDACRGRAASSPGQDLAF